MTYNRFFNLVKDAAECATEEAFLGNVGFPADIELDKDSFLKAVHIIYATARGSFKDVVEGYNLSGISRALGIPYRSLQNWTGGKRLIPDYEKRLIAYALINDLGDQNGDL